LPYIPKLAAAAILAVAALGAGPALAHQTAYDGPVSVTTHVTPDDEPIHGQASTITIVKVAVRNGTFSFKTGRARLKISNSSGSVLLNKRVGKRTRFTFPSAGAYRIVVSGRVKRSGRYRGFSTSFAVRAS
jgi:hypothetical protein